MRLWVISIYSLDFKDVMHPLRPQFEHRINKDFVKRQSQEYYFDYLS